MAFARIANLFSTAWSASSSSSSVVSSSSSSSVVSSSSAVPSSFAGIGSASPYDGKNNKNNLRLSSSLQDLSTYRLLNPREEGGEGEDHSIPSSLHSASFSKEKPLPWPYCSARTKKCLRALLFLLFLLLLAFLIYLSTLFLSSYFSRGASKFYLVLDCGSTGTRAYVYRATTSHQMDPTTSLPFQIKPLTPPQNQNPNPGRAYHRMETEPGFHKLVHNISGLKAAIKPLVSWAQKQIPQHAHKSTSVFLYATAGVRRLPTAHSNWILDNAWSILQTSPFFCRKQWVRTITGIEEAYFGWIALNHRTGMLGARPRMSTYGALDLGGSSLQVTFESHQPVHTESNLKLRIGDVNHHLTAYSLSGYGLNDAFDKSVVHLFKRLPEIPKAEELLNGMVQLKHPCLQTGYKEQYLCSQCASRYQQGGSPVVSEKTLGGGKSGVSVRLVGVPNWEQCSALAKVAVNVSEWSNMNPGIDCDLQPCALGVGFPQPLGQFYAMSGFYVVYRFFNLTSEATLDDVLEKGRDFCEKTWEVAKNSVAPQPFIEQYCFRAPYIASLLREGLHITDNQIIIGSGSITWTLAVALLEAGKTFSSRMGIPSYEILQMRISPIILILILFLSLMLLLWALSCVGNWRPKFLRRQYLPLFRHNSASSASVLRFQRWSPINSGDGRAKMPLSPTTGGGQQRSFGLGNGLGSSSGIQMMESSLYPSTSSVTHSYSSNNLGQMQFDSGSMASFWSPHRSQMRLQSRRSQSREDLSSSLAETHLVKV
ncbi:hypothetical protein UlMin_046121 [Ulmus minor]